MEKENKKNEPWFLYILRCSNTYLYTGISNNVKRRVLAHRSGKGARFTRNRSPIELVYVARQEDVRQALKTERAIKKYSKDKKEKMILEFQQNLHNLKDETIIDFLTVNDDQTHT